MSTSNDLRIARVTIDASEPVWTLTLHSPAGRIGCAPLPADPRVRAALEDIEAHWIDADPLALEARWQRLRPQLFATDTALDAPRWRAFGALEFASAQLGAAVLGVDLTRYFGGAANDPAPHPDSPARSSGEVLDAEAFSTFESLSAAALRSDATTLRFDLWRTGGPVGLRRLLALARALYMDAEAGAGPTNAAGWTLARALANAFDLRIDASEVAESAVRSRRAEPARIRRVRLRRIKVPLAQVYVSAMYLMDAMPRTLIELETDDGIVGLGETAGAEDVFRLTASVAKTMLGADPLARRSLARTFAPHIYDNRNGRNGWQAFGGLEVACWDNVARRFDLPLARLLGSGSAANSLPVVCLLPTAILDQVVPRANLGSLLADVRNVEPVVAHARDLQARCGVRAFKYKSSGLGLAWDVAAVRALRAGLAPATHIRFDPNAAYDPCTALAVCRALEPYAVTWYEDPTDGIEGLARVRRGVTRPIATNMAAVQFDQLAPAVRRGALDIVLGDTLYWGGIEAIRDLSGATAMLGLSLANHAFYETGVSAAANLHTAIGLGLTAHPHDQANNGIAADVIAGDRLAIRDGCMTLPAGPGIGVALDEARVAALLIEEQVIE